MSVGLLVSSVVHPKLPFLCRSHEPYFSIFREKVELFSKTTKCNICGQEGHMAFECKGEAAPEPEKTGVIAVKKPMPEFQVWVFSL